MKDDTKLTHSGRKPFENHGVVNPPVYHASTILFPTMEEYLNRSSSAELLRFKYSSIVGNNIVDAWYTGGFTTP